MLQDANAVRTGRDPGQVLIPFPLERVRLCRPSDEVLVRHAGEVTIYETPDALAQALRDHDPIAAARLKQIDHGVDRARQLVCLAEDRERDARELMNVAQANEQLAADRLAQAQTAERQLRAYARNLVRAAGVGAALALVAFWCGL